MTTMTRLLGRSRIPVSALGFGCWAIGGPLWDRGMPLGWGEVDDDESVRAIHAALDRGVTFFDTANIYGAGHSERILGRALAGRWDDVVIATKFGNLADERTREVAGTDATADGVRRQLFESLRRLDTDHIDLYQLHLNDFPTVAALELVPVLDDLVQRGHIRAYGWSTDYPDRATAFALASHSVTAIQHDFSVLVDSHEVLAVCERFDLASINRGPLAMGLLTGKYTESSQLAEDDVRGLSPEWMEYFKEGRPAPEFLDRLDAVREVLRTGGRTLAQGAIGYLWGRSDRTIPIPGCRNRAQVIENAGALDFGPLAKEQVDEIDELLGRR